MFSWVPIYKEIANKIVEFRNRQTELIEIVRELGKTGLPVIGLKDRKDGKAFDLPEIEPFTFFAVFNRGIKVENRLGILRFLKEKFSLSSEIPTEFSGIPIVQNTASWFFSYADKRKDEDIPILWRLADEAVTKGEVTESLFNECLNIRGVGLAKITAGLFWLRPNAFMPLDKNSKNYLKSKSIEVKVGEYSDYSKLLQKIRDVLGSDYKVISYTAYHGEPVEPPTDVRYWQIAPGEGARLWEDFKNNSIAAVGWSGINYDIGKLTKEELNKHYRKNYPEDTERQIKIKAAQLWNFITLKIGDKIVINRGRSLFLGLGVVKNGYKFRQDRSEYKHTVEVEYYEVSENGIKIPDNIKGKFGKTNTPLTKSEFEFIESLFGKEKSVPKPKNYWWVNQGQTYEAEKSGGFLWAPQKNKRGIPQFHWQNVEKVKKGDIIFHYSSNLLRSISLAQSDGFESTRPQVIPEGDWEVNGWRVNIQYEDLISPISIEEIGPPIAKLELKYGPVNRVGGVNQGYLFQLNEDAVRVITSYLDLNDFTPEIRSKIGGIGPIIPPAREIIETIHSWMKAKGFVISKADLVNFFCCLRTKPFVILAGISGTGKTKLVRLFAEAVGATTENHRFEIIPVRPDWNDNSELLGFFDLNNQFQPGSLIPLLIRAHANPDKPYLLCLDEMNLARVEHYFSDFLSIIESRKFDRKSATTDQVLSQEHMQKMNKENLDMDVQSSLLELIERFPNGLGLPENLYVIGTVNMDETTHPFSRKVLDRANTIEFNEINLKGGLTHPLEQTLINKLDLPNSTLQPQYITMQDLLVKDPDASNEVANRLEELNEILSKAGCQIGYRIRDEAAFFMKYVKEINDESLNEEAGFERVVLQKILPRVQGSSYQIKVVLEDLLNEFVPESKLIKLDDDNYTTEMQSLIADKGPLAKKIGNMLIQFMEDGFTSFWAN